MQFYVRIHSLQWKQLKYVLIIIISNNNGNYIEQYEFEE